MPHEIVPSWSARRSGFAVALGERGGAVPAGIRDSGGAGVSRFDVYRNNVAVAMIGALEARFPVVLRLVGEEAFRELARRHARSHLPATPMLFAYGDDFAETLAAAPELVDHAYLPDVARLEAVYTDSFHAADARPFSLADLAALAPGDFVELRLALHPALRRLASPHPVATIWAAHQVEGEPAAPEHWTGEHVLVTRPELDVELRVVTTAEFDLIDALEAGETVGRACDRLLERGEDPGRALVALVAAGAFVPVET